jgi:NTE family protein
MSSITRFSCGLIAMAWALWSVCGAAAAQGVAPSALPAASAVAPSASAPRARPRIGLVLSGGGARGLAHVGVLKVLERERVPIDVIAGTSMGAIIGGLYASGMHADELETELRRVNWQAVFASRVDRELLSQRRKEEDFEIATALEIGMRDGELRVPLGALSGRGLETLLRRFTLPVRSVHDFDALPIPFRAIATDLENGQAVVLAKGDLALALRSSMSVPGVFAPTEVDGRILGDGGLVNNVPVDVARAMGADVVIVVNIGTPLAGRDALSSVGGLTAQMINILTEQNVQRSLASLAPADVLIAPALGPLTAGDFDKVGDLITQGERGAQPVGGRLESLALDPPAYAQWQAAHARTPTVPSTLAFVRFEGTEISNPERFVSQLESKPGQVFDAGKAERDARRLAASGDYIRADYLLVNTPQGDGLVFDVEDKPWGPHYFRIGLDLSTDFRGGGGFNLKISHNRHWLDANGTEWRNRLQIGQTPRWFTELYHPLRWTMGISNDWFVAGYGEILRRSLINYDNATGTERARLNRSTARVGLDLGQPWGEFGEVRLGVTQVIERFEPEILAASFPLVTEAVSVRETGLRLGAVIDQLDYANFPQRGYRVVVETVGGSTHNSQTDLRERFTRFESEATLVHSWGVDTLNGYLRAQGVGAGASAQVGRYSLGGFQQLSGYAADRFDGNHVLFGRLTWYRRSPQAFLLTRGAFIGATLEAGNAWLQSSQVSLKDLRTGGSLFVGADTGLGPLYFGLTYAPRGSTGLYLFIGRP